MKHLIGYGLTQKDLIYVRVGWHGQPPLLNFAIAPQTYTPHYEAMACVAEACDQIAGIELTPSDTIHLYTTHVTVYQRLETDDCDAPTAHTAQCLERYLRATHRLCIRPVVHFIPADLVNWSLLNAELGR